MEAPGVDVVLVVGLCSAGGGCVALGEGSPYQGRLAPRHGRPDFLGFSYCDVGRENGGGGDGR